MNLIEKLGINPDYAEFMEENLKEQIVKMQSEIKTEFYPAMNKIFRFLISNPKVVIVGQDPYPQPGVATGIAFAVKNGTHIPPSLEEIIFALEEQFGKKIESFDTGLSHWIEQGVMLMNSSLTVAANQPGSHSLLWDKFVTNLILHIDIKYKPKWVLLGRKAQKFKSLVPNAYEDYHPVANSYGGKKLFTGEFFKQIKEIEWIT